MTRTNDVSADDLIFTNHLSNYGSLVASGVGSWKDDQILEVELSALVELLDA